MEAKPDILKIGGAEIDLSKLPPITFGLKRELWAQQAVDVSRLASKDGLNPEEEFRFTLFLLRKVRPETTEDEVSTLALRDVSRVAVAAVNRTRGDPDVPTSGSSPSSPGGAGGDPETSSG